MPQGHGNKGKKTRKTKTKPRGRVGRGPFDHKPLLVPSHLYLDRTSATPPIDRTYLAEI